MGMHNFHDRLRNISHEQLRYSSIFPTVRNWSRVEVVQSSVTCSSHPRTSANRRPVLLHPFQGPVHVRSWVICHYTSVSRNHTLINQRNSSNAKGSVSPLVMGRCRSPCSKGQGAIVYCSTAGVS
ncbi:hypothetical protein M405DRAFT_247297 [Rhizopogon salebrosus TDB-379]|nr:hypothetical protein M405DRAFT_247297 [Rhizopogon salebrosus TDB-379]